MPRMESAPKHPSPAVRGKERFKIAQIMLRLRIATRNYPKAAMFVLAEQGFDSAFEILLACMISIRTLEEVTLRTARKLFQAARTPAQVAGLTEQQIDRLIHACSFHHAKARQIHEIARRCRDEFGGKLPEDEQALLSFRGVGPKCANLALGIASGRPIGVPVDIHVHRVTNRWGYVSAPTPEQTSAELESKLPRRYWLEINKLLVPFGKHICTAKAPLCSTCPVLEFCRQVGVTAHR